MIKWRVIFSTFSISDDMSGATSFSARTAKDISWLRSDIVDSLAVIQLHTPSHTRVILVRYPVHPPESPRFPLTNTTKTAAYLEESVNQQEKKKTTVKERIGPHAAVEANTSDLFAFVSRLVLAAKSSVKSATSPSFRSSECTL